MIASLHVNGLSADHGNIRPLYARLAERPDAIVTTWPLRRFALGRWPEARAHLLHLHWIDHIGNSRSTIKAARVAVQLLAYLAVIRLRGARIVWTMHNASAHELRHSRLERLTQRCVIAMSRTVHVPNPAMLATAARRWSPRVLRRFVSLPLPRPAPIPAFDRALARRALGLDEDAVVVLGLGDIRPYKGFDLLARALRAARAPRLRLIMAGRPCDPVLAAELADLVESDRRCDLRLAHQTDNEFQRLLAAADWLVLPYRACDNSGVLTQALAAGVPLIVADLPGLLTPLAAEPAARRVVPRTEDPAPLTEALEATARCGRTEWAVASAAAARLSEAENHNLAARYRALYEFPSPDRR